MIEIRGVLTFALTAMLLDPGVAHADPVAARSSDSRPSSRQSAAEAFAAAEDHSTRLTIPVLVDGKGPYPFVVDTGASRTVISRELASTLRLPVGPRISMDDALGHVNVETAIIDHLDVGSRRIAQVEAPVLSAANLGADGMLGVDSLRNQRVVMDFHGRKFLVGRSAEEADDFTTNTTIVLGRKRFGQLILVDAESQTVPIFVILDSGAQSTVGNIALQRLMTFGPPNTGRLPFNTLISVTGIRVQVEVDRMPEIQLGGITIRNVPIAYARLHTFAHFGVDDRPAILLGMDVLHLFHSVAIDFRRGEASFVAD